MGDISRKWKDAEALVLLCICNAISKDDHVNSLQKYKYRPLLQKSCPISPPPPPQKIPSVQYTMKGYNQPSSVRRNALEKIGALCGPFFMLVFFIGWPSAHFIPPLAPTLTPDQVTAHYRNHESAIKAAAGLMTLSAFPYIFWVAAISGQMARIPGVPEIAIYAQFLGGVYTALFLTLPAYLMAITAYRLDRPQELTQLMNDISWILMMSNFPGFVIQDIAFSYSILLDRRPRTLFPRWLAYVTTALTLWYWPAFGIVFVKTGVIAWNGALSFWAAAAAGALNIFIISFYLYKATAKEDLPGEGENLSGTEVSSSG